MRRTDKAIFGASTPGGRMVMHDSILLEERTSPYYAALFSAYILPVSFTFTVQVD